MTADRDALRDLDGVVTRHMLGEVDGAEVARAQDRARRHLARAAGQGRRPAPPLSEVVRRWAEANGGELNRLQVRELLRELDRIEEGVRSLLGAWQS